jgi:hypothetical protein
MAYENQIICFANEPRRRILEHHDLGLRGRVRAALDVAGTVLKEFREIERRNAASQKSKRTLRCEKNGGFQ